MSTAIGKRGGTRRRLLGAVVVALIWVFPIYWMISSAFLPTDRRRTPEPTFLPLSGTLSDFRRVLTEPSFFDASRVSLAVTGSTVVGAILFGIPRNADDEPLPIPGPGASRCSASSWTALRRCGRRRAVPPARASRGSWPPRPRWWSGSGPAPASRPPTRPASGRARAGRPGHRPADYYRHTYALKPEWQRP